MRSGAAVPASVSAAFVPSVRTSQPPARSGSVGRPNPWKSRRPWSPPPPGFAGAGGGGGAPPGELGGGAIAPAPSSSPRAGTETMLPTTSTQGGPRVGGPLSAHDALIRGRLCRPRTPPSTRRAGGAPAPAGRGVGARSARDAPAVDLLTGVDVVEVEVAEVVGLTRGRAGAVDGPVDDHRPREVAVASAEVRGDLRGGAHVVGQRRRRE